MQCVHAAYHQNLCDQNLAWKQTYVSPALKFAGWRIRRPANFRAGET
jgi:hypothetical protein